MQDLDEDLGVGFHQGSGNFLPTALRGQRLQLAGFRQLAHQGEGFGGDPEAQAGVAGGEARYAQDPQGILGERRGNVAQQARLEVGLAAVGVYYPALFVLGHGVDGQVTASQVFLQGHVGAGMEGEAAVAAPALSLGARQGVFLAALRMKEDREVGAHRAVAAGEHLVAAGTDHHPVDIGDRTAEKAIAHGAADLVNLHGNPPRDRRKSTPGCPSGRVEAAGARRRPPVRAVPDWPWRG